MTQTSYQLLCPTHSITTGSPGRSHVVTKYTGWSFLSTLSRYPEVEVDAILPAWMYCVFMCMFQFNNVSVFFFYLIKYSFKLLWLISRDDCLLHKLCWSLHNREHNCLFCDPCWSLHIRGISHSVSDLLNRGSRLSSKSISYPFWWWWTSAVEGV